MKKPEQYFCDMCGKEIMATSGFIDQIIPVVTESAVIEVKTKGG